MLNVTTPAAAKLKKMLCRSDAQHAVRIVNRDRKLCLRRSTARKGDTTFLHEGRLILLLDERMSRSLDARTLEVGSTDAGSRLRLKPR